MSTIPKKPSTPGQNGRNSPANGATSPSPAAGRRSGTGAAPSTPSNGIARTRSTRTPNGSPAHARAASKKVVGASDLKNSTSAEEEDARMESSAILLEMKERLETSEQASEEYKKQMQVLQSRLDEATKEQGKLEDKLHEEEERVEGLENEKRETVRQKREIETIYEAERAAAMKEREETVTREEELRGVIERLKDSLSQKDRGYGFEEGRMSRTGKSCQNAAAAVQELIRTQRHRQRSRLVLRHQPPYNGAIREITRN